MVLPLPLKPSCEVLQLPRSLLLSMHSATAALFRQGSSLSNSGHRSPLTYFASIAMDCTTSSLKWTWRLSFEATTSRDKNVVRLPPSGYVSSSIRWSSWPNPALHIRERGWPKSASASGSKTCWDIDRSKINFKADFLFRIDLWPLEKFGACRRPRVAEVIAVARLSGIFNDP
jgi:hypothetical protein